MAFRAFGSPPCLMRNALVALLILLSAFLLFWRLDTIPLWRDETTTANWARLMAESDVWLPRVYDGKQLIVQAADGHDVNSHLLPAMQSWLQFYVSAVGFKVFGVSTWSARAPFALLGGMTLFVLYRIGVVLFGAGLRPLLLPYIGLLSIYFLYAARNCRYYVIILLAASLLLLEMCRYFRDPEHAASKGFYIRLGLYGALLYSSNYLGFAGMWLSLGVFALIEGDRRFLRNFVGPVGHHGSHPRHRILGAALRVRGHVSAAPRTAPHRHLRIRSRGPRTRLLERCPTHPTCSRRILPFPRDVCRLRRPA